MAARAGAGKIIVGDKDITGDVKDLDIKINTDSLKSELDKAMVQAKINTAIDRTGDIGTWANTPSPSINLAFDQYYDPNSYRYKLKPSITDPWGTNPELLPEVEEVEVQEDVTIYLVVEDGQAIPMSAEYLAQYLARRSSLDGVTVQEWTKVEDGKFELQ